MFSWLFILIRSSEDVSSISALLTNPGGCWDYGQAVEENWNVEFSIHNITSSVHIYTMLLWDTVNSLAGGGLLKLVQIHISL